MYESFYGLKEKPFSLLPDPAFLYVSRQHEIAIALLEYSLENQAGFCVITGKAGTGKTTLLRRLLNNIGNDVAVGLISNTHHSFGELLRWILHSFHLDDSAADRARQQQVFLDFLIAQYAKNRRTLLIIDEAQNLSAAGLEELRMLSNINSEKDMLLQMILVGQPPLREILRRPELEQFAQRVTVDYHLDSLGVGETSGYIRHRLAVAGGRDGLFTDEACKAVFIHTRGIPRLINLLCDLALVYGYAAQVPAITANIIEQVVREREVHGALPVFAASTESEDMTTIPMKDARSSSISAISETAATRIVYHGSSRRHAAESVPASAAGERMPAPAPQSEAPARNRVQPLKTGTADEMHILRVAPPAAARDPDAIPGTVSPASADQGAGTKAVASKKSVQAAGDDVSSAPAAAQQLSRPGTLSGDSKKTATTAAGVSASVTPAGKTAVAKPAASLPAEMATKPVKANPRRRATDQTSRLRRYQPALAALLLVSIASVAWLVLDRWGMTRDITAYLSQARATITSWAVEQMPSKADPVAAREPPASVMAQPDTSATPPATVDASVARTNDAETEKMKQLERERDAVLAIAEAARKEREAMRKAAQARERALAAEREQMLARERELAKEHELSLLRERVRAQQAQEAREAELARLAAERAAAKAPVREPAMTTPAVVADKTPKQGKKSDADVPRKPVAEPGLNPVASESASFTANPCKGPSARFLSTCE